MRNGEVAKCASVVGYLSSRSAPETGEEVVMLGGKRDRVLAALGFVFGTGLVAVLITSGSRSALTLTVTGGGYEDSTGDPAPATVRGWTKSLSSVDFRPIGSL